MRYEQNPFEKPAKNLEQNSLDSLLTSTTWKRGKKKKPKAANREKNKSCGKKKKRKRKKKKPKAANREKNKSCGKGKKKERKKEKEMDFNVNGEW